MFDDVDEGHLDGEKTYKFYYNREERLKNAPQIVQDYYDGKLKPVKGLKVLVANKSNRYILLALVFFIATTWIYTGFNKSRNYSKINQIDCQLESFCYAEEIYTTLKISRNPKAKKTNPCKVAAEFFIINGDNQVISKESESMLYETGEQFFRKKFADYDILRIDAIVTVSDEQSETKELSAIVKR